MYIIYGIIIKLEPIIPAKILTLILLSTILMMKYLWK